MRMSFASLIQPAQRSKRRLLYVSNRLKRGVVLTGNSNDRAMDAALPVERKAASSRGLPSWTSSSAYPVASLLLCVLAWDLSVRFLAIPEYLVPSPAAVGKVMVDRFTYLIGHTWVTTLETVLGFFFSIAIGIPLALAIVWSRVVEKSVYPILVLSQAVPKVALAPLLLVWLGFGMNTKVVVAVLIAFFPIVISMVVGLRSVPLEMIDLGRSMGLGAGQMFFKIRLPYALPSLFGGLKVAITLAVVGAVVGEFVGADRGLGYVILLASGQLQMDIMFAAIVFLVIVGVTLFAIVQWVERAVLPWHPSVRTMHGGM
jgi:NitT/TauT family transport system permease protein